MKGEQELELVQMARVCGGWALSRPLELDEPEDGETPPPASSGRRRSTADGEPAGV